MTIGPVVVPVSEPPWAAGRDFSAGNQWSDFRDFVVRYRSAIYLNLAIHAFCLVAIGLTHFIYIDDGLRALTGEAEWGVWGSRWGRVLVSLFANQSAHVTDLGLISFLLTAVILSAASVVLVYFLVGERATRLTFIVAAVLGLNPWLLNFTAFRTDGHLMTVSVLLAVLVMLWARSPYRIAIPVFIVFTYVIGNFYETSIGLTAVLVLTMTLLELLNSRGPIKPILLRCLALFGAIFAGLLLAGVQALIQARVSNLELDNYFVSSGSEIPSTLLLNIRTYARLIWSDSNWIWILSFALIALLFAYWLIRASRRSLPFTLAALVIYFPLTLIASASIWLLTRDLLIAFAPRYIFIFSTWLAVLGIVASTRPRPGPLRYAVPIVIGLFSYLMLTFPLIFAAMLHFQNNALTAQSSVLMTDVMRFHQPGDQVLLVGDVFRDSVIVGNTTQNYPILERLVPRISDGSFWPLSYQLMEMYGLPTGFFVNTNTFIHTACPIDVGTMDWLSQSSNWVIFRSSAEQLICVLPQMMRGCS